MRLKGASPPDQLVKANLINDFEKRPSFIRFIFFMFAPCSKRLKVTKYGKEKDSLVRLRYKKMFGTAIFFHLRRLINDWSRLEKGASTHTWFDPVHYVSFWSSERLFKLVISSASKFELIKWRFLTNLGRVKSNQTGWRKL